MAVERTKDNPHGWGYVETRTPLDHYQLSPRIQIVVGDIIKIRKGSYRLDSEGTKISTDRMKGKWKVQGIFENKKGETEMNIQEVWSGGLLGASSLIRLTGDEYPSSVFPSIIKRPHVIKLATPRKRRRKKNGIKNSYVD
tara:strand:+ start:1532 stop:1951 length:420 start_codon:yes stop_codon:yes gene_type:complete